MSYCRFSSDDWRSDFYVYESAMGWVVHVAGARHVPRVPLPDPLPIDISDRANIEAWVKRSVEVSRIIMHESDPVPIGLSHDGAHRVFGDPADAADWIEELAALGYHVPEGVIEDLRDEATP